MRKKWQSEFQKYLNHDFASAKKKNPRYSMRSYAQKLGISSGVASDILSGKRDISSVKAIKILQQTSLPEKTKRKLKQLISPTPIEARPRLVGPADILSDWVFLAILHFYDLDIPQKSAAKIAERLSLSESRVQEYIHTLMIHNLLRKNSEGELERTNISLATSDGITSEMLQKYHMQCLHLAEDAIKTRSVEERDFTSLILAGNKQNLAEAKKIIRSMYQDLETVLASGSRDEVYRIAVSIFPMLKKE